jgi:UDP-N-acetylglucosamine--N-acetylmuramyl-(pentapeptide) pyrophosphoryl-undecaprenol N-acetylglucosamine transferase
MNAAQHSEKGTKGTVLIMAAGTGGHIFPALSIARNLQSRGYRTEWLGTPNGMEVEVLRNTDIVLHKIDARGLRGKSKLSVLGAPFMIVRAIMQTLRVLKQVQPCCVLGMGGYVTGPGGVAAKLSGNPLLIHEQNAIAGLSNRLLALIANRVMQAFPDTFEPKTGAISTGNPVRAEIGALVDPRARVTSDARALRVLVLGGSLGAVAINRLIPEALQILDPQVRPQVLHQVGRNNVERAVADYIQAGLAPDDTRRVQPFIDDMAAAYDWADLVICRAGATTVCEIAAAGKAAVFIPYPHAVDDHQTRNAQWLSSVGAALLIQQRDLSAQGLASLLREFTEDRTRLLEMATRARALAQPAACDLVTEQCMEACKANTL